MHQREYQQMESPHQLLEAIPSAVSMILRALAVSSISVREREI